MRLKVIVCSILCLMPVYADGDIEAEHEPAGAFGYQGGAKSETPTNQWAVISGNVGFLSNYSFRGITETFGGPAVQGELIISQKKDEGLYAGLWGSNVDGTTAPNGCNLELIPYIGYAYLFNPDFSVKFEVRDTRYPGSYAPNETKDSFDMLEFIPGFSYKWFSLFVAIQYSNVTGFNQNLVKELYTPLNPNGNTRGSFYTNASLSIPMPRTEDRLKLKLWFGYWKIRNYNMLSYAHFGTGLNYTLPKNWSELTLSANVEATTARKKYRTNVNESGQSKNLVAPKFWIGIYKEF